MAETKDRPTLHFKTRLVIDGKDEEGDDLVIGTRLFNGVSVYVDTLAGKQHDLSIEMVQHRNASNCMEFLKPTTPEHRYSFSITFTEDYSSFTGFYADPYDTRFAWNGSVYTPPNPRPPPAPQPDPTTPGSPSPPPYTPEDKLLHELITMTAEISVPRDPTKPELGDTVKDLAQEEANKAFERILLNALPNGIQKRLLPNMVALDAQENEILNKHKNFFEAASVPFTAHCLLGSGNVSQECKNSIDQDKINRFWTALSSQPPTNPGEVDPISEFGWTRGDDKFVQIKDGYANQQMDVYTYGFLIARPQFKIYLSNPVEWHNQLSWHLNNSTFLRGWSFQNSFGHESDIAGNTRRVYMWNHKLRILEAAAHAQGKSVAIKTDVVIKALAAALPLKQMDNAKWSEEMYQSFRLQIDSIMKYTDEDIATIMKSNKDAADSIVALRASVRECGSIVAFTSSVDRFVRFVDVVLEMKRAGKLAVAPLSLGSSPGTAPPSTSYRGSLNHIAYELGEMRPLGQNLAGPNLLSPVDELQAVAQGVIPEHDLKNPQARQKLFDALQQHQLDQEGTSKAVRTFRKIWSCVKAVGKPLMSVLLFAFKATVAGGLIYGLCGGYAANVFHGIQSGIMALHMAILTVQDIARFIGNYMYKSISDGSIGKWLLAGGEAGKYALEGNGVGTKILKAIFGTNAESFLCRRLAPIMCVMGIAASAYELDRAIRSGKPTHVAFSIILLCLSVVDGLLLIGGFCGAASWCGPIGIVVALATIVVSALYFFFFRDNTPEESPMMEFVNGVLKERGFHK